MKNLLLLCGLLGSQRLFAAASPWIYTQYEEVSLSLFETPTTWSDGFVITADYFTRTVPIILTVTPPPTPVQKYTSVETYLSQLATIVHAVVPSGKGKARTGFGLDNYYVPVTYTAPGTCSSKWTYSTNLPLFVPLDVYPEAYSTIVTGAYPVTEVLVKPTNIPSEVIASAKSSFSPYWANSCSIPAYATGGSYSGPYSGGDDSYTCSSDSCVEVAWYFGGSEIGRGCDCPDGFHLESGVTIAAFICIWIFSWLGFFLICGLIESWVWFRRLSLGKSARRGLPICFAGLCPLLSCFLIFCMRQGFKEKTPEQQKELRDRWNKLGGGTAFGQWLSWGFRFKYPPFLGEKPLKKGVSYIPAPAAPAAGAVAGGAVAGQPQQPQMQQQQPQYLMQNEHGQFVPVVPVYQMSPSPSNPSGPYSPPAQYAQPAQYFDPNQQQQQQYDQQGNAYPPPNYAPQSPPQQAAAMQPYYGGASVYTPQQTQSPPPAGTSRAPPSSSGDRTSGAPSAMTESTNPHTHGAPQFVGDQGGPSVGPAPVQAETQEPAKDPQELEVKPKQHD